MTVEELQELEEESGRHFDLITNSQDIEAHLNHIGQENKGNYGLLFVEINEGEINEMYGHSQNVPYNHLELDQLVCGMEW